MESSYCKTRALYLKMRWNFRSLNFATLPNLRHNSFRLIKGKKMKVFRSSNKFFSVMFLAILTVYIILSILRYTFYSYPFPFYWPEIGRITLVCFISAIPAHILLTFIYPIKLSKEFISGYKDSGIKTSYSWADIVHVKLQNKFFIKYLYLYNEHNKPLMVIPYKWMAKQGEFEEAIREYTSSDHPLREFF